MHYEGDLRMSSENIKATDLGLNGFNHEYGEYKAKKWISKHKIYILNEKYLLSDHHYYKKHGLKQINNKYLIATEDYKNKIERELHSLTGKKDQVYRFQ